MCIGSHARAPNVAWNWRICASPSPEAVGSRKTRGIGERANPRMSASSEGLRGSRQKPPPPMAKIVGSGGKRDGRPIAEVRRLQGELDDLAAHGVHAIGAALGA